MARIVLETSIAASPATIVDALTTSEGIASWWTDDVDYEGGAGGSMRLGFPVAPLPFELLVERISGDAVAWRSTGEFPPHWVGTTVRWTLIPDGKGSTVHLAHDGWTSDEGPFASAAYTWAQLLGTLKRHAEIGEVNPLFTKG